MPVRFPVRGARQCLWSEAGEFRGWQPDDGLAGASPYGRYLRERAGF
ncbi:MAG: hypothetical protein M3409_12140 [Gemmatimonadota bacterium]|nr:hypothetical protein [Gemmatimonadota bacterium]